MAQESVIGSGHRTIRSSDAEIRTSSSPVANMDNLTTLGSSVERTLLSVTNSTVPAATTESVISDTEKISSVHLTEHFSVDQNRSSNISSSDVDTTELGVVPVVTRSSKTPTDSSAQSEHADTGSHHQTLSTWHAEKRTSSSHTESTYTSVAFSTEIPVSSDLTHRSSSVSQAGASDTPDFSTGSLLTQPSSKTRLPAAGGQKQPASLSDTEGKIASSHGDIAYVATPSPRGLHERTLRSLTDAGSSTSSAEISSSSDRTESSSIKSVLQIGRNNSSWDARGFTANSTDPLHNGSHTATESVSAASGSGHRAVRTSAAEERVPDSGVTGAFVSAASPRTEARMFPSPTSSNQPSQLTRSSSSSAQMRSVSDVIQSSSASPIAGTAGINISPDATNFSEPSTDPSLMDFHSSSESASTANRSSHKPSSMSALENRRTSDYDTTSTYLSTAFTGTGERTLRSLLHSSKPLFATESSTSSAEMSSASDVIQPSSVSATDETQGFNISSQAPGFVERSTDSHPLSERASPESESSQQPTNISVVEQRTSDPHATSMVISTAFTRAGEKTLQSLTNSSLSPDAAQSSASSTDIPSSADATQTSSISARAETDEGKVTLGVMDFTASSADPMPTRFRPDSQGASAATGSSHQLINISSTEKKSPGSHITSTYISAASTDGGDRMLRSVTETNRSDATRSSPFGAELSSAADVSQSSSMSSTAQTTGMKNASFNATDLPLLTDFSLASENVSTVFGSSHQPVSISDTETRTSDSPITRSAAITRDVDWSLSLTNTSMSSDARGSFVPSTEMLGSSERTQALSISSVTQAHETNSPLRATDFTDLSLDPLLTHSLSTPENTSRASGSSHQSISVSTTEEGTSGASTTSFYISTTSNRSEETLRPLTNRSTLTDTMESPSSTSTNTVLTDLSLSSSSLAQSKGSSVPSGEEDFTQLSTKTLLTHPSKIPSYSSSSANLSVSDGGRKISSSPTESTYISTTFSRGVERTPQSGTNSSIATETTETSATDTDTAKYSDSTRFSPSEVQTEGRNSSSRDDARLTEPSTKSLRPYFSKASTYSSETEDPSTTGRSHQSLGSSSTEERISHPYTDSTYASATLTKSEERTSQPLTNSTSTHTTERPTSYTKTANSSELFQSFSEVQTKEMNVSADDMGLTGLSTETLFTHSSKIPTYSSFQNDASSIASSHQPISGTDTEKRTSASRTDSIKTTTGFPSTLTAATKPTTVVSTTTTVTSSHTTDVDECLSNPCPAMATCNNTQGSFVCKCPLGYQLEKGKCNLVRTFVGQGSLKLNTTHGKYSDVSQIQDEITTMLDVSLSTLPGYHHSIVKAVRESNSVRVSVQTTFSLASNVTLKDIRTNLQNYARACKSTPETCHFISSLMQLHTAGGLCEQKDPECDKETSECTDVDGIAVCKCRNGYFKYNKKDHSCRACEDGFKLENETCVSCPFGLGGFNCGNPYQLITVVIAAAGGGLLLILGIALIITCCRKNKNDISKLIFKSGDFQMSPYAEYPKNPRGPEWGRETIEMQENGSTKNLLQMTDVYYSPTNLRNPELERNGLYPPYTGLPGSRHSCIYPATATTAPTTGTSTPTTSVSTATTAPTTGTPAPASPDNTTSSTPPAAGPPTCEHNPCGNSAAQCITLYQNYTCQCPFQFYYNSSACVEGKVFPGQLTVNIGYSSEMQNVNSPKYIEVYQAIENFFQKAFSDRLDYGQTVIETLRGLSSARKRSTNPTEVTFMNIFEAKTTLSNETVAELITKVNGGDQIDSKSYKPLSECAVYGCDLVTTTCQALPDGLLVCKCKDGAFKKNQEDRVCSYCRSTCTSKNNEHCTYNKTGFPVCSCLPDFKSQGSKCVACPVGYSGVECESNFLLIVIILACVLGAAILILLSVVIYLSVRTTRKSDPEKKRLLNLTKQNAEEISNGSSGSNMEAGGRIFPRIKTNVGRANQGFEGSNPYVANPPNRNYLPEKDYDYDDDYEMSARGDGFKLQRRS
ncbi:HEG-like protein 1 isoform A [Alligator mississippiensis]|uniref:HEG-like protein 1 isoform A n=1 Tax=Alligator mississippiensis TaxID=8496 RepID=A0A151M0X1_ALLMI|nr:HEG-like protein 1 isoform A [Alligator mississippiensis]